MRVLFLDFDGVLNSRLFLSQMPGMKERLDPAAVARLDEIVKRSAAKVVVTSTWRAKRSVEELGRLLRELGFQGEVIDATPQIGLSASSDPGYVRAEEIRAWLDEHPSVTDYAVLDDIALEPLAHVQVKTEFEEGLTDEHVGIALSVFGVEG